MNVPADLKYTKEHEWARVSGDEVTVGITDYAQGELGDIVYVELPEVGTEIAMDASFGTIEAVKAVNDLYAPLSGTVIAINDALEDAPDKVNTDPYGDGWMIKIKLSDPAEVDKLMDSDAYAALI
ncbi:MAG: glycine cleavage system protein GcvH [Calditrichaeota bacterium]|nr:glycine cleavage system protein GcvH [Calditrichota bacterium]MCB0302874.1 glycine cleavage system protein GcvH [Calditrichota bacterium]MCB0312674.1 glycine cleavage system protein GcvH [Calditrichota bacterium]MCB9088008.1 glycine cleavage system protein GcvH [Calditrichia bacterium]